MFGLRMSVRFKIDQTSALARFICRRRGHDWPTDDEDDGPCRRCGYELPAPPLLCPDCGRDYGESVPVAYYLDSTQVDTNAEGPLQSQIVAAGGICAPAPGFSATNHRACPCGHLWHGPSLRDLLPTLSVPRGGVRFVTAPSVEE